MTVADPHYASKPPVVGNGLGLRVLQ